MDNKKTELIINLLRVYEKNGLNEVNSLNPTEDHLDGKTKEFQFNGKTYYILENKYSEVCNIIDCIKGIKTGDKVTKIVKANHLTYDLLCKGKEYYFKTIQSDIKFGDFVLCETKNGLTLCTVNKVYDTIEELMQLKDLPNLQELKRCRKTINSIEEGIDIGLSF